MMRKLFGILFISTLSLLAQAKTEVSLRGTVEVGTSLTMQFEDIVVLKNQSAQTIRSVIDMELPFSQGKLAQEELSNWLRNAIKERPDLRDLIFKIPSELEIKRVKGLSITQIKNRIQNRLGLKCSDCSFQIQISNLPEVKVTSVHLDWKDVPLSGAFMLPVTSIDGQNLSWISGQIKAQRPVIKSTRVLRTGDTIQESDLVLEASDVSFSRDYYLQKSNLVGKKVSRFISMGTLITSNDIQRDYDVRQGQMVRTIAGNETFEISLQTIAQDSGVAGDVIRVRNMTNQKIMSGRILEKGTVIIE